MTDEPRNGNAQPWRVLASKITFEDHWLKVRTEHCVMASGVEVTPYHIIESPDWASVVAFTPELKIVLVREYRHARGKIIDGIPGGVIDQMDSDAEAGARRELLEETGYGGGHFMPILTTYPDPGNQSNTATVFLALGVEMQAAQSLDIGEAVDVLLEDFPSVLLRLSRGDLQMHAVHAAAMWSAAARILMGGDGLAETAPLRSRLLALLSPESSPTPP